MKLARENDPINSEIPHWIGVYSMQGDSNDPSDERWEEICEGVESSPRYSTHQMHEHIIITV